MKNDIDLQKFLDNVKRDPVPLGKAIVTLLESLEMSGNMMLRADLITEEGIALARQKQAEVLGRDQALAIILSAYEEAQENTDGS